MKRLLGLALFAAFATSAIACNDTTGPGNAVAGTYTLRTIGGVTPPITVSGYTVLGGQIILDAAGNYTGVTTLRTLGGGSQFDERIDGYWTVSGNQIQLYDQTQPNLPYVGTITNSTITILAFNSASGADEVYSK